MPKTIKNIFYDKLTFDNFVSAHNRAKRQKMYKNEVLRFDLNLESNIVNLVNSIKNNTFHVGKYHSFKVYEPKERIIHALPYRDRIVHQWYVEEFVKPYIMPKFISSTFACLPDRGTHKSALCLQKMMRKYQVNHKDYYILKCDIRKYFYSIDTNILFNILKKYISDKALLKFTYQLIFENRPFSTSVGIPIGNYTSQYFANIYLNELDQFIKRTLRIHYYVRYMDDFVLLCENKKSAIKLKETIQDFLAQNLHLELNQKSRYYPCKMGVNFCGYRIFPTHLLLRNSSKKKIHRNIKKWNKKYKEHTLNIFHTMQQFNSWRGHASHCNSYNLEKRMIEKCDFLLNNRASEQMYNNLIEDSQKYHSEEDINNNDNNNNSNKTQ